MPRNNFYNENWQGARLGEHPKKNWDPLFISAEIIPSLWAVRRWLPHALAYGNALFATFLSNGTLEELIVRCVALPIRPDVKTSGRLGLVPSVGR